MNFEFDPTKEEKNIQNHQTTFSAANELFEGGRVFYKEDNRKDYGETRIIAVGEVNGRLMIVVFTWRNGQRRIISARKANERERRIYYEKQK